MIQEIAIWYFKILLLIFAAGGFLYHALALANPQKSRRIEERLGVELGVKRRFIPWLENNRMTLHERLISSKPYNAFAAISLIVLIMLTARI